MPLYKYIFNRCLTAYENFIIQEKLSEYHTGYRAFSRKVLLDLPLLENSDDFVFDNQILVQAAFFNYRIGEITSPCTYNQESSSINFFRSIIYGFGVLWSGLQCVLEKCKLCRFRRFDRKKGSKITLE